MPTKISGTTGVDKVEASVFALGLEGEIKWFARNTPPSGFLKANGALISRTTYATLFAAIGTTFGVGDGSTTFGLPDLRAEFVRGWDDSRGIDSNRSFGSTQADAMQGHKHETAGVTSGGVQPYGLGNTAAGGYFSATGVRSQRRQIHRTPTAQMERRVPQPKPALATWHCLHVLDIKK